MSGYRRRLERLEEEIGRRGYGTSPTALWADVLKNRARPDSLWRVCRPCLPQLEDVVLAGARRAMEQRARLGALEPWPEWGAAPVGVLAEVVAYPPGQSVPSELLDLCRRRPYEPDRWRELSKRYPDHEILGFKPYYREWLNCEVAWILSPEPDARRLRQRLHSSADAGLNVPAYERPGDSWRWPDTLLFLVQSNCESLFEYKEATARRRKPR